MSTTYLIIMCTTSLIHVNDFSLLLYGKIFHKYKNDFQYWHYVCIMAEFELMSDVVVVVVSSPHQSPRCGV